MLPGFRFLVAAIVCSISLTVFGMGAAALLRAAHEQFASNSSWRSTQASGFTTFLPPAEPAPVLAVLRVEPTPPVTPPVVTVEVPVTTTATAPADQPSAPPAVVAVPEKVDVATVTEAAALPTPSLPAETVDTTKTIILPSKVAALDDRLDSAKPDAAIAATPIAVVEKATDKPRLDTTSEPAAQPAPAPSEVAPAPTAIPVSPPAPQVLASADPTMTAVAPSAVTPAPAVAVLDPIAAKLAALAEQPVRQERPAAAEHRASVKVASVQLRRSILKKRKEREKQLAARRAKQRRVAQRVRAARQAEAQQQQQQQAFPDPFGQPFSQPQAIGQQAAAPRTR
ncbi:conserved exported protein of unknown function [Bradyrhizobium sp. ORS 285]|uniref:hypothetical protein n=1 Tax=Bradyrhizobium sp. ORS 285 TaxID=115808 RepID=UPI00024073F0|nr:hypothetical protein [Bradyrhizobium sp. ORS 285]CCD90234.1 conserved exported hypothetical protein [Bradyrhizobium sp. ORS 285]SMX60501.1 conserved exported protein of unknown function [Bradyrhizobium sp. ORS 285]